MISAVFLFLQFLVRFGSRADLYFENYKPLVKVNQKTIAGETLLAKK